MKRVLLLLSGLLLLLVAASTAALFLTPQGRVIRQSLGMARSAVSSVVSFRPDGRWWDCTGILRGGAPCSTESVAGLPLSPEERALLQRLDGLPPPPAPVNEDTVINAIGRQPQSINVVSNLIMMEWPVAGNDGKPRGKLSVTLAQDQLYELKWLDPERFFLWKRHQVHGIKLSGTS